MKTLLQLSRRKRGPQSERPTFGLPKAMVSDLVRGSSDLFLLYSDLMENKREETVQKENNIK